MSNKQRIKKQVDKTRIPKRPSFKKILDDPNSNLNPIKLHDAAGHEEECIMVSWTEMTAFTTIDGMHMMFLSCVKVKFDNPGEEGIVALFACPDFEDAPMFAVPVDITEREDDNDGKDTNTEN